MSEPNHLGWIVLCNDRTDGTVEWTPNWDGELHTDRDKANRQLDECVSSGFDCTLAEVRQVSCRFTKHVVVDAQTGERK